MLDTPNGQQHFSEADKFFRAGRYAEALNHLQVLNSQYPNTKNVLYPMAMCLERLGRGGEALPLCETLVAEFQDPRASEMVQRLRPTIIESSLDSLDIDGDYTLPDLGPMTQIPVPVEEEEKTPPWKVAAVVVGGIIAVLALLMGPYLLQKAGITTAPAEVSAATESVALLNLGVVLLGLVMFQGFGTAVASVALGTVNKLPANTFSGVLLHVGVTLLGVNMIALILSLLLTVVAPLDLNITMYIVEHLVLVIVFAQVYGLKAAEALVFLFFFFVFMCVATIVAGFVFGTGLGVAVVLFS